VPLRLAADSKKSAAKIEVDLRDESREMKILTWI
jgi:hypothetical protein